MKRTFGIYFVSFLAFLPVMWLLVTSDLDGSTRSLVLVSMGVVSVGGMVAFAWRGHFRGRFLPNRCHTCDHGMARLRPGELKPPPGAKASTHGWRCTRCGRLA